MQIYDLLYFHCPTVRVNTRSVQCSCFQRLGNKSDSWKSSQNSSELREAQWLKAFFCCFIVFSHVLSSHEPPLSAGEENHGGRKGREREENTVSACALLCQRSMVPDPFKLHLIAVGAGRVLIQTFILT